MINIIHTTTTRYNGTTKIIKNVLLGQFERWSYNGGNLYSLIENTDTKSITMSKYDLIGYYRGYDTKTKEKLIDVLENLQDDDMIIVTIEDW